VFFFFFFETFLCQGKLEAFVKVEIAEFIQNVVMIYVKKLSPDHTLNRPCYDPCHSP